MLTRRTVLAVLFSLPFASAFATAADKLTFEVYADAKDEYRWRLKNGDTILATSGQGYSKKADCTKMVDNFKTDISKYEFVYEDDAKKGKRFWMKAKNGNNVGSSTKAYPTEADARKVVDIIAKGVKDAEVKELPKEKK